MHFIKHLAQFLVALYFLDDIVSTSYSLIKINQFRGDLCIFSGKKFDKDS